MTRYFQVTLKRSKALFYGRRYVLILLNCALLMGVFICMIRLGLTPIQESIHKYSNDMTQYARMEDNKAIIEFLLDTKYNKSTGNTSTVLPTERNMILVSTEDEVNATFRQFMRHLLLLHPHVIYLGSLTTLLDRWYLSSAETDMDDLLDKLYACHFDILPIIVQYANDILLKPGQSPWCVTGRVRSKKGMYSHLTSMRYHRDTLDTSTYCVPPPKTVFYKLCRSHHIAVDVTNSFNNVHVRDTLHNPNVKSLRVWPSTNNSVVFENMPCFCASFPLMLSEPNHDNFDLTRHTDKFVISDNVDTPLLDYCMQELFNYLDIYFSLRYLEQIWIAVLSS